MFQVVVIVGREEMRSRQPAGSTTTIARDHFPTIIEQDRGVRFPVAIAIHPEHGEAYDRAFRIPSRMTGALRGFRLCFLFSTSPADDRPPRSWLAGRLPRDR
jgi:hypothetical protein